jgi:hypothetical protein
LTTTSHSRSLRFVANATLVYPLVSIGLIYGQLLLESAIFTREVIVAGEYTTGMWFVLFLRLPLGLFFFVGALPIGVLSVIVNIAYLIKVKPSIAQAGIRMLTLVSVWLGWFAWLETNSHVLEIFVD